MCDQTVLEIISLIIKCTYIEPLTTIYITLYTVRDKILEGENFGKFVLIRQNFLVQFLNQVPQLGICGIVTRYKVRTA